MFTSVCDKYFQCVRKCVYLHSEYAKGPRNCMYLILWARSVGQESYFSFHVKPQKCSTFALMCVLIRIIAPKNSPSIISKRMTDRAAQRLQAPENGEVYSNLDGSHARGASFSFLINFLCEFGRHALCLLLAKERPPQQSSFCFLSNLRLQKVEKISPHNITIKIETDNFSVFCHVSLVMKPVIILPKEFHNNWQSQN